MNWTIGRKMLMGLGFSGLATAGFVVFNITQLGGLQEEVSALDAVAKEETHYRNITVNVANLWQFFTDASLTKDAQVIEKEAKPQRERAMAEIKILKDFYRDDASLLGELDGVTGSINTLWECGSKMVEAYAANWARGNEAMEEFDKASQESFNRVDSLVKKLQTRREQTNEAVGTRVERTKGISLFTGVLILVVSLISGILLTRSVTGPMAEMTRVADALAKGIVEQRITYSSTDEIGRLVVSFGQLIGYLKEHAHSAESLSRGDLSVRVAPKSDKDILSLRLGAVGDVLQRLMKETNALVDASRAGQLTVRGNPSSFEGSYRSLMQGINDTLDAVVQPIQEASMVLMKVAAKDMTARVTGNFQGDNANIKNYLNSAVAIIDESLQQVVVGADQIASASGQIGTGAQSLAQGTSEQASSLEEVSSSLQEMNAMTRQNAANAKEARGIAEVTKSSAENGVESMKRLSEAMDLIKKSSDDTAKIIKTIDEIAFQTNLLALNAAVEAARAGEAGKGFAVVAEEVRNLAMRSAEAAKNTSTMIEGAVKNAQNGVAINLEVTKNLGEIHLHAKRVSEVMAEIAAASDQQSQGVGQVNTAMEQMNQLTQQNAANSEESASASEELSAQAQEMRAMVAGFKISGQRQTSVVSRPALKIAAL
ncbi:MAG: HAMP domain-containing protein [Elusimicrobia bacterium]|nr:HAMP domain-containing protein [Elusimicrobiota bacterium]